jgi:stage II sporulation protein E
MLLKSDAEAFVTMDLCIIDLITGQAEFIKTGAEPSFIMRNRQVDTVKASALPIGVVAGIDAESTHRNMKDGDVIVMVTDGIENRECGSMWISEFIEKADMQDDDKGLADKILNHAIEQNNGKVKDDMTVLSVRLKEVS